MSATFAKQALQDAQIVVSVGDKPRANFLRNVGAAIVLSAGALLSAGAEARQNPDAHFNAPQGARQMVAGVPGQVMSVSRVNTRSQSVRRGSRTTLSLGTIAGAVVGGYLGSEIGSGSGRDIATGVGAITGGAMGNRIAQRRDSQAVPGYNNVRRVRDDVVVRVAVQVGNSFETYDIQQPAAVGLRRGDQVLLVRSETNGDLLALPVRYEQEQRQRPRRRP